MVGKATNNPIDPTERWRHVRSIMVDSGVDKATGRAQRTRRAVLDAALALFAERGYAGTTIPDVMAKASVGAGSLYRLFPSKEALANEVFREAKRRLLDRLFAPGTPKAPP